MAFFTDFLGGKGAHDQSIGPKGTQAKGVKIQISGDVE
jgi:hypothetical protein